MGTDIEAAATHLAEHIGTWHVLAWVDIMLGDVADARAAFETALSLDRNFAETHGAGQAGAALQRMQRAHARSRSSGVVRLAGPVAQF